MIVGSGLAGLVCARDLAASGWSVTVLSAASPGRDGASHRVHALAPWILVTAPWSRGDSPEAFARDLGRLGAGRQRPGLAERLAADARAGARELIASLDLEPLDPAPIVLPGDIHPRGLRCRPRRQGPMLRTLLREVAASGATVIGRAPVVGLLLAGERAAGVLALDAAAGALREVPGDVVVLACGGLGAIFPDSTCPRWCRGTAVALGSIAGVLLHRPSLTQSLPVSATAPGYFPSSEALLDGRVFVDGRVVEPSGGLPAVTAELAMSVRRGRFAELRSGGPALPRPGSARRDPRPGGIPLTVAVHHSMGGIAIDEYGRTSLPALYACGEAAGGVQGARRMMGTGLLEAWVFGRRAARAVERDHARVGAARAADGRAMVEPVARPVVVDTALDRLLAPLKVIRPAHEVRMALEELARVKEPARPGTFDIAPWMAGVRLRTASVFLEAELEAGPEGERSEGEARRAHA